MYIYHHVIHYTPLFVLTRFVHVSHGVITATDRLAVTTRKRNAGMMGVGVSEESLVTFIIYDMLSLSSVVPCRMDGTKTLSDQCWRILN